ncbi:ArsR/SmtB family transcription factor [Salinarimonas chemoclinalis]|uniref:ArsR/SmtB family transcription factor n=1 Tax=Salinarimonas chemoclinalis TaxID=3241599 RepID=UPI00355918AA
MTEEKACKALAALSQETRLRIVRRLVIAGEAGMPAGELGTAVGTGSSSLSFHLRRLEEASLVRSRRSARNIVYTARLESMEALVHYLLDDCCAGARGSAGCIDAGLPCRDAEIGGVDPAVAQAPILRT